MRLAGRVAIVTGAGRGIGRATAIHLAAEGAAVVLAARNETELTVTAAEMIDRNAGASLPVPLVVACDVADPNQVAALVERTLATHGRIDILVNNAGFARQAQVEDITLADWQTALAVNTTGTYLCCQAVLPAMRRQRGGKIINVVSGAGKRGSRRRAAYSAAKFGVIGFSQSLQLEVKNDGIVICCVCPGPVDTEMRAANNPGEDRSLLLQPDDLAEVIVFVATRRGLVVLPEIEVRPLPHM